MSGELVPQEPQLPELPSVQALQERYPHVLTADSQAQVLRCILCAVARQRQEEQPVVGGRRHELQENTGLSAGAVHKSLIKLRCHGLITAQPDIDPPSGHPGNTFLPLDQTQETLPCNKEQPENLYRHCQTELQRDFMDCVACLHSRVQSDGNREIDKWSYTGINSRDIKLSRQLETTEAPMHFLWKLNREGILELAGKRGRLHVFKATPKGVTLLEAIISKNTAKITDCAQRQLRN